MWFNTRKQVLTILARQAGIAVLAIILAVSINFFTGKAIDKISDSLSQKERLSKTLTLRIENIQQLKNSLALLGDNDQKIQEVYPPADNILAFVSALDSIAKQNSLQQNLRFGNFTPTTDAGGISVVKTDYTINLNGTINTLSAYLEQMEKLPFAATIGSVNLLAAPPNGWNGNSSITINGTLYARQTQ
jgi:Tfp pilus assembly protein PilO